MSERISLATDRSGWFDQSGRSGRQVRCRGGFAAKGGRV